MRKSVFEFRPCPTEKPGVQPQNFGKQMDCKIFIIVKKGHGADKLL